MGWGGADEAAAQRPAATTAISTRHAGRARAGTVTSVLAGRCPAIDLDRERALHEFLLEAIKRGLVKSAHDCSEGGLACCLAECCLSRPEGRAIGAKLDLDLLPGRPDFMLFCENQTRAVISANEGSEPELRSLAGERGVDFMRIGKVGGDLFVIEGLVEVPVEKLRDAWEGAIPRLMGA